MLAYCTRPASGQPGVLIMAGAQSNLPPRPLGFEYFCIAIRSSDKVRVILGTDYEVNIIRQAIQESWPPGIQNESFQLNGVHEFKLNGRPFLLNISFGDAVMSRRMAGSILNGLCRVGWRLIMSSDLTRTTEFSMTTWVFKKVPVALVSSYPFMVVGLSSTDSFMILNAPTQLHQTFKDVIGKSWPPGIQNWSLENGVLLIKLRGTPWRPDGEETVNSRVLLQTLVNDLLLKQWNLYGNSNLKSNTNTLFFEHDPNIMLGQYSVNHFIISLNKHDTLRLIGVPDNLNFAIRDTIQTSWLRGIQGESRYFGSWEFKLRGNPWWASGEEAVDSRYLILKLIETLQAYGWSIIASIASSRKLSDKSALLFRQSQPRQMPVFCLSLNDTDKLRLINAPEDITKVKKVKSKKSKTRITVKPDVLLSTT